MSAFTTSPALLREGDVLMVIKPNRLARNTANGRPSVSTLPMRGRRIVVLSVGAGRRNTEIHFQAALTTLGGAVTRKPGMILERQ